MDMVECMGSIALNDKINGGGAGELNFYGGRGNPFIFTVFCWHSLLMLVDSFENTTKLYSHHMPIDLKLCPPNFCIVGELNA